MSDERCLHLVCFCYMKMNEAEVKSLRRACLPFRGSVCRSAVGIQALKLRATHTEQTDSKGSPRWPALSNHGRLCYEIVWSGLTMHAFILGFSLFLFCFPLAVFCICCNYVHILPVLTFVLPMIRQLEAVLFWESTLPAHTVLPCRSY